MSVMSTSWGAMYSPYTKTYSQVKADNVRWWVWVQEKKCHPFTDIPVFDRYGDRELCEGHTIFAGMTTRYGVAVETVQHLMRFLGAPTYSDWYGDDGFWKWETDTHVYYAAVSDRD